MPQPKIKITTAALVTLSATHQLQTRRDPSIGEIENQLINALSASDGFTPALPSKFRQLFTVCVQSEGTTPPVEFQAKSYDDFWLIDVAQPSEETSPSADASLALEVELKPPASALKDQDIRPSVTMVSTSQQSQIQVTSRQKPEGSQAKQGTVTHGGALTFKRCLIAGIWGSIVLFVGQILLYGNIAFIFLGIPLLGLPWIFFDMSDKESNRERISAGGSLAVLLAGSFITLFCMVPIGLVIALGLGLFR
jgi:hypothetical protein